MPTPRRLSCCPSYLASAWLLFPVVQPLAAQDAMVIACDSSAVPGTYCYTDNDDHTWSWESACGLPLTLQFLSGTIEANMYDMLRIYEGLDGTGPMLFANGQQDMDLAGITIQSIIGYLYMEMYSNDTISCAEVGGLRDLAEWAWTVNAVTGTVGLGEAGGADVALYPNPATDRLHIRSASPFGDALDIRIVDLTGRTVHRQRHRAMGEGLIDLDLQHLQPGHYAVVLSTPAWTRALALQRVP